VFIAAVALLKVRADMFTLSDDTSINISAMFETTYKEMDVNLTSTELSEIELM
jgi:hypothetical protein